MKFEMDVSRNSQFICPCRKILFCCILINEPILDKCKTRYWNNANIGNCSKTILICRKMESEKSREDKPSFYYLYSTNTTTYFLVVSVSA